MKTVRSLALAAVAVAGLSTIASAQITNPGAYRLDLTLTLRSVTGQNLADVQTGGSVNAVAGQTYRVELRYRINDDDLTDGRGSRGLTAASILISNNAGLPIQRAGLSVDQGARGDAGIPLSTAPANPDTSATDNGGSLGLLDIVGATRTGMMDPFRGGVGGDDNALANGVVQSNGTVITPLSLSAPGQNSFTGLAPSNNNNAIRWGVYAFTFTYTGGTVNFTASAIADPITGNRYAFWSGETVPTNSGSATDGTISFIPAPGAAALLGLGGLIAARRRRA